MLRKIGFLLCAAVGAAALTVSIVLMAMPRTQAESVPAPPAYVLREESGHLALYSAESGEQVASWAVFTALLPSDDAAALRAGIPVTSQKELQQLLEDFGA